MQGCEAETSIDLEPKLRFPKLSAKGTILRTTCNFVAFGPLLVIASSGMGPLAFAILLTVVDPCNCRRSWLLVSSLRPKRADS